MTAIILGTALAAFAVGAFSVYVAITGDIFLEGDFHHDEEADSEADRAEE